MCDPEGLSPQAGLSFGDGPYGTFSTAKVGGWRRLAAVGRGWWLAVGGGWRLAVGGGWRLVVPGGYPQGLSLKSGFLRTALPPSPGVRLTEPHMHTNTYPQERKGGGGGLEGKGYAQPCSPDAKCQPQWHL